MSLSEILSEYRTAFGNGILVTMKLCAVVWISGLFCGFFVGVSGFIYKSIKAVINFLYFLLSSIPVLVLLFWIHYPLQEILELKIDPFISTALTLSIINIFSVAHITCEYLFQIPYQYKEAATVCNISKGKIISKIYFPILLRGTLISMLSLQINMLHLTLFGSLISVEEIFRVCQQINAKIYQPVEVYSALAIFFVLITVPVNLVMLYFKKKLIKINL